MSNEDTMLSSALEVATEALKKEQEKNGLLRQELARSKKVIEDLERRLQKKDPDVSGLLE